MSIANLALEVKGCFRKLFGSRVEVRYDRPRRRFVFRQPGQLLPTVLPVRDLCSRRRTRQALTAAGIRLHLPPARPGELPQVAWSERVVFPLLAAAVKGGEA